MVELGFSLGVFVLGGLIALFVVLTVVPAVLWIRDPREWPWNNMAWPIMTVASGIFLVGLLIAAAIVAVPYEAKYLKDYRVSGTVTAVSNVFENASGEMTSSYVVSIDSLDRPVTLNDPRAVRLLDKSVDLTCNINWNHRAADTYTCRIASIND